MVIIATRSGHNHFKSIKEHHKSEGSTDMKKANYIVIAVLILVIVVAGVIVAVALTNNSKTYTYAVGDFIFTRRGSEVTLKEYKGSDTEVQVTDIIDGFKVTAIGERAFYGNETVEKVVAPSTVTSIGSEAFSGAKKLRNISMKGLVKIGEQAFSGCTSLNNLLITESLKEIGARAFYGCSALQDLNYIYNEDYTVRSSLERVGAFAFKNTKIDTILIPESLKTIGENAFASMKLQAIVFYEGVETIEENAFAYDNTTTRNVFTFDRQSDKSVLDRYASDFKSKYIKDVSKQNYFPESLKTIGDGAFRYDKSSKSGLGGSLVFGKNLVSVGEAAFENTRVSGVKFDNANTEIGAYAFANTSISSVSLPENIKILKEGVFLRCSINNEVVLPKSVETIETGAFAGNNRTSFKISINEESPAAKKYVFASVDGIKTLKSKDGKVLYSIHSSSVSEGENGLTLLENVSVIESYAFSAVTTVNGSATFATVSIPETVKEIRAGAFADADVNNFNLLHSSLDFTIDKRAFDARYTTVKEDEKAVLRVRKGGDILAAMQKIFEGSAYVVVTTIGSSLA